MKVVEPGRDISCRLGMKNQNGRDRRELIVVSQSPVPDEDISPMWKPSDMRSAEEKERLMKYLIITLRSYHCL